MKALRTCLLLLLTLCLLAACQSTPATNSEAPAGTSSEQATSSVDASSEEASSEASAETSSEEVSEPEPPREGAYMEYEIPENYKDLYENPYELSEYADMEITATNSTTYTITYH